MQGMLTVFSLDHFSKEPCARKRSRTKLSSSQNWWSSLGPFSWAILLEQLSQQNACSCKHGFVRGHDPPQPASHDGPSVRCLRSLLATSNRHEAWQVRWGFQQVCGNELKWTISNYSRLTSWQTLQWMMSRPWTGVPSMHRCGCNPRYNCGLGKNARAVVGSRCMIMESHRASKVQGWQEFGTQRLPDRPNQIIDPQLQPDHKSDPKSKNQVLSIGVKNVHP